MSCSRTARSAAPRCRPAPRPARMRRSSCATATRSATSARACSKAVAAVNGEIFDAIGGMDAEAAGQDRRDADRARRHAEQGPARRERDPRRVAGRREGGGGGARPAALPLCRRHLGAAAAGADDEHHQRRRACRQSDRLPGIHDHAGRRAELCRRPAHGRRGVPDPEEGAARCRPQHQCRRRGRFRAEPEIGRGGAGLRDEVDRSGRLQAGRGRRAGARFRLNRVLQERQVCL